jgi:hypothetical protein
MLHDKELSVQLALPQDHRAPADAPHANNMPSPGRGMVFSTPEQPGIDFIINRSHFFGLAYLARPNFLQNSARCTHAYSMLLSDGNMGISVLGRLGSEINCGKRSELRPGCPWHQYTASWPLPILHRVLGQKKKPVKCLCDRSPFSNPSTMPVMGTNHFH